MHTGKFRGVLNDPRQDSLEVFNEPLCFAEQRNFTDGRNVVGAAANRLLESIGFGLRRIPKRMSRP